MSKISDLIWPTLEQATPDPSQEVEVQAIRAADFSHNLPLALMEARRLSNEEDDRVKSTEAKASNFLLVAAALVPLLTYLETSIWDGKLGTAPKWVTLLILGIAVAYLAGAVVWALRTVRVSTYHGIGATDIVSTWNERREIEPWLAKETLVAVRMNQTGINAKVSAVKMTYAFMVRAILSFCLLLLVQATAEISYETGLARGVMWFLKDTPPNSTVSSHRE